MLNWEFEAPGKHFLTLGPSRVVNPIDTTENKISRTWLIHQRLNISTPSDSWSETSHSNITVITYVANVPWVTLIKYVIWNWLLFIEFCIDLLHGKFKAFCWFFGNRQPPRSPIFFFLPSWVILTTLEMLLLWYHLFCIKKGVFSNYLFHLN